MRLVNSLDVIEKPLLLRSLFRGGYLDSELIAKIVGQNTISVEQAWSRLNLAQGQGYKVGKKNKDASTLIGLPNLTRHSEGQKFVVDINQLQAFDVPFLERVREPNIYRAPLCIVPKSIGPDRNGGQFLLSHVDVAFNESYYGYSGQQHSQGSLLVEYLFLVINSKLAYYFPTMTSAQFGVEREALYKEDLDNLPLVPLETLTEAQRERIKYLVAKLTNGAEVWNEIDELVADIYGLSSVDCELIDDALRVALPFTKVIRFAQSKPNNATKRDFINKVERILRPINAVSDRHVYVTEAATAIDGWGFLCIHQDDCLHDAPFDTVDFLTEVANRSGATRVFFQDKMERQWVGICEQNRYWTQTRARELALEVLKREAKE